MTKISNGPVGNIIRAASVLSVIAMLFISVHIYKAPVSSVCVFIVFVIFYVQIPGLLIMRACRVRPKHTSAAFAIGLLSGWALNMLLYFVSDALRTNVPLYAVAPAMSLLYFVLVTRGVLDEGFLIKRLRPSKVSPAFCVFAAMSLLFVFLKTQYVYMSPEYCDFIYMNADKAYHMGLINSLSFDYPLQSPWIQGRFINYHIFTEILYAIPVRIFDISSDVVLSSCGPLMTAYTLCLSFYAFFRTLCKRADRAGLYCLLMLLSNIFIVRSPVSSIAFLFAYKNENTAGYGIAGAMITMLMFKEWYESRYNGDGSPKTFGERLKGLPATILLLALIMCETGIKGPMGVVILAGIWGTWLLGVILRRARFSDILPFALFTAGFLAIYTTVLGSKGQSNSSGDSMFALATISDIAYWKEPFLNWMHRFSTPYEFDLMLVFLIFMAFMLTAYTLPWIIGYLRELWLVLSKKKDFDFTKVVIYAASIVGLVAMLVLNYSGHSQIYFGLITVFFAPVISYWLIEDLEEKYQAGKSKGIILRSLYVVFFVILAVTTVSLAGSYRDNIAEAKEHADPAKTYNMYKSISNDEYEAMIWIRDNTPEDSLLATDRYYSVPLDEYTYENRWSNRFFLYAVYSQRFCYIAGSGYNLGADEWPIRQQMIETNYELYDPANEDRGELAEELGVDYVVVSKRFTALPSLESDDYDLCYSNDDVDIYKVAG